MRLRTLKEGLANLVGPRKLTVRVVAPHNPVEALYTVGEAITVRAWWNTSTNMWEAIEGSHRLATAAISRTPIKLEAVRLSDVIPVKNPDGTDVVRTDEAVYGVTVEDALQIFKEWGERPIYKVWVES